MNSVLIFGAEFFFDLKLNWKKKFLLLSGGRDRVYSGEVVIITVTSLPAPILKILHQIILPKRQTDIIFLKIYFIFCKTAST